jgi:hypothetical protein
MSDSTVSVPLCYLLNTRQSSPDDVVSAPGGAGRKAALLFSGTDRAEGFVRSTQGFQAVSLSSQADLENFLAALEQRGFTHVVVDPAGSSGAFVAIADFRRTLTGPPGGPS